MSQLIWLALMNVVFILVADAVGYKRGIRQQRQFKPLFVVTTKEGTLSPARLEQFEQDLMADEDRDYILLRASVNAQLPCDLYIQKVE